MWQGRWYLCYSSGWQSNVGAQCLLTSRPKVGNVHNRKAWRMYCNPWPCVVNYAHTTCFWLGVILIWIRGEIMHKLYHELILGEEFTNLYVGFAMNKTHDSHKPCIDHLWYAVPMHIQLVVRLYRTIPHVPNTMDIFPYESILIASRENLYYCNNDKCLSVKIAWHKVKDFTDYQSLMNEMLLVNTVIGELSCLTCSEVNCENPIHLYEIDVLCSMLTDIYITTANATLPKEVLGANFQVDQKRCSRWKCHSMLTGGNMETKWETTHRHSIRQKQALSSWISLCHQNLSKRENAVRQAGMAECVASNNSTDMCGSLKMRPDACAKTDVNKIETFVKRSINSVDRDDVRWRGQKCIYIYPKNYVFSFFVLGLVVVGE